MGAIHHPGFRSRQAAGFAQGQGHPDSDLLSDPAVASKRLSTLSIGLDTRQREIEQNRHEPTDAPIPRRDNARNNNGHGVEPALKYIALKIFGLIEYIVTFTIYSTNFPL